MSFARAAAWITAHPPRGLQSSGSSHSTGPGGVSSVGFDYADDQTSRAWTNSQLEIGVVPAGTAATVWRVDGIALWQNPSPVHAPDGGRRLAVTVADGCPASDRGVQDVTPGPSRSLLPTTAPRSGLICAYAGLNGRAFTLKRHIELGEADATRLARLANAISLAHTTGTVTNCPADFGTVTVVAFAYPNAVDAALWLTDSGCRSVSNGTITTGFGGDATGLSAFASAATTMLHR